MTLAAETKRNFKVEPISRETFQEQVYRRVCDLILDGEIAPGQLVTIQAMAGAFGVSHMPVREALKRLSAANALTVVSGRSIGIPNLSREKLTDLRDVRVEIEGFAATRAARHISVAELGNLQVDCDALRAAATVEDVKTYLRANRAFHFSIYRAARSESLLAIIENLWLQIGPYLNLLRGSGNYTVSNFHHQMMVDGLKNGDGAKVRAALQADIDAAYEVLLKLIK
jgi:DNA-binding GntR family transcriptional regulator